MSNLVDELLARPAWQPEWKNSPAPKKTVEIKGDTATVEIKAPEGDRTSGKSALTENGLNRDDWVETGFRQSEWTMANGETGVSTRFTYARKGSAADREPIPVDDIAARAREARPVSPVARDIYGKGFILALGDMQFGKIDGDGIEGTVDRAFGAISRAANAFQSEGPGRFSHIHVAFLGDHVEGFTSQGGANIWRTRLTMSEQIRLTRLTMLHALEEFAPFGIDMTMAAVPGNHGDPQRFSGTGVTRFDDSHDTESLIAVSDAARMNPAAFGHVKFLVPDTDELTVTLDVAGTQVSHAHGHMWRKGKHFDWWEGQAFGGSPLRDSDLLLSGHLHTFLVDTNGERMFVQVPALESESTWWRHRTGMYGNPGVVVMSTKDGHTSPIEVIR